MATPGERTAACAARQLLTLLCFCLVATRAAVATGAAVDEYATAASNLIDPAKLSTLRERGANPRVQKYVALLAEAQDRGISPKKVAGRAVALAGYQSEAAKLTARAMVANMATAKKYGCLDAKGRAAMQRGQAAIVQLGHSRGQELTVDHIIPRAVVPELDKVIANLELMPLTLNERKNSRIGARQVDLGRKLHKAGLLSAEGLRAVESRARH